MIRSVQLAMWCVVMVACSGDAAAPATNTTTNDAIRYAAVSAGAEHTCATTTGQPMCWGNNSEGNLGMGTTGGSRSAPGGLSPQTGFIFGRMSDVTAGASHSCGINGSGGGGAVWCWGRNADGQLGVGDLTPRNAVTITTVVAAQIAFRQVRAGAQHTCAITYVPAGASGRAYCWGQSAGGRLGDGITNAGTATDATPVGTWHFDSITVGAQHTCGLSSNGEAYCWGVNDSSQLGVTPAGGPCPGFSTPCTGSPLQVSGGLKLKVLSAGSWHTCGLTVDGTAYCWGANHFGQLGNGSFATAGTPTAVAGGRTYTALDAGDYHTCAIASGGTTYCWGRNGDGQLGATASGICDGASCASQPVSVAGTTVFRQVAAGGRHSCGLTADSTAYCWGANNAGQLGDGTTTGRSVPTKVITP